MASHHNRSADQMLIDAVLMNNLSNVQRAWKAGADLNSQIEDGHGTPLYLACEQPRHTTEIVQFLLEKGAGVNTVSKNPWHHGQTPIFAACASGNLDICQSLLDAGADLAFRDQKNATALHGACCSGQLEIVRELVRRRPDLMFFRDDMGRTPFDITSFTDRLTVTRYLLQQYRESMVQREGRFALHAILREATDIESRDDNYLSIGILGFNDMQTLFRLVLAEDPDSIRLQDTNGDLPIHIACGKHAHIPLLEFLLEQDPDSIRSQNESGSLPLHMVFHNMSPPLDMLRFLVQRYPDSVRSRDTNGDLPIHIACGELAHIPLLEFLLEQDPDSIRSQNESGSLPLHMAFHNMSPPLDMLRFLVQRDPDSVRSRDGNGDLPIHLACQIFRAPDELIRFLVEQDVATLHIPSRDGALPLHWACHSDAAIAAIKYLVERGGAGTLTALDGNGALPLHRTCQFTERLEVVEYLVKANPASVSVRTLNGDFPVTLACRNSTLDVIFVLLKNYPNVVFPGES